MKYFNYYISIVGLLFITSCGLTNNKKGTIEQRSFKLTKDSTFIGVWGKKGKRYPKNFSDNLKPDEFHLLFIYSKDSNIYITRQPILFDTTAKDEHRELEEYFDRYNSEFNHWWTDFKLESPTQITIYKPNFSEADRFTIDKKNNLIFQDLAWHGLEKGDTAFFEQKLFYPYYFKTIPNSKQKE